MKNKVVVITGASEGIGKALAEVFAAHGSKIVIGARNEQKLKQTADIFMKSGAEVKTVICDVSSEADCRKLIADSIESFGQIDVLINNAGAI